MVKITQKQQKILEILLSRRALSSSEILSEFVKTGDKIALVTVKRALSEMTRAGLLTTKGAGPSTAYEISAYGRICTDVDAKAYVAVEPDKRHGQDSFN